MINTAMFSFSKMMKHAMRYDTCHGMTHTINFNYNYNETFGYAIQC